MPVSRVKWLIAAVTVATVAMFGCTLLVAGVAGAAGSVQGDVSSVSPSTTASVTTQEFDADRTEFRVRVRADGSADWIFRYEQRLEDDAEREDFESFAETFRSEETNLYRNFINRAERLTDDGADATGRDMAASEFTRDAFLAGLDDDLGVVEMTFHWEGFAPIEDGRIVVGDVFEGGLYVGSDQRLVFERSEELVFESTDPDADDMSDESLSDSDSITYHGERSFTDNRPKIVYAPAGDADQMPTPDENTPTPGPGNDSENNEGGWLLPTAFLIAVLLSLGAVLAYRSGALGSGTDTSEGTTADQSAEEIDATVGTEATEGTVQPAVTDEELIPDDERVLSLLEDHGGRMKQVDIVNETDWSKSKVSMLLSEMEEDGQIKKLRVGRENIISLPGREPDAAGSPFEDET